MANGLWMSQIGRNVTDAMEGVLRGKRYLIHDRDPLFTREFVGLLEGIGRHVGDRDYIFRTIRGFQVGSTKGSMSAEAHSDRHRCS